MPAAITKVPEPMYVRYKLTQVRFRSDGFRTGPEQMWSIQHPGAQRMAMTTANRRIRTRATISNQVGRVIATSKRRQIFSFVTWKHLS